jgi:hypothetical protein
MEHHMSFSSNQTTTVRRKRGRNVVDRVAHGFGTEKLLAQEVLEDFVDIFRQKAFYYLRCDDDSNFRYYAEKAVQTAKELAPYQLPKLAAVARGADGDICVRIIGGLPEKGSDANIEPLSQPTGD